MINEKKIIAYKGFDKDFKCRDFQYEVGKTYEMDGNIKCCSRGFHACESPMEVFDHYDMLTSRFAEVEQSGEIDKEDNSTKICSSRIKIKAELKLADIINLGVEWLKEITAPSKIKANNSSNIGRLRSDWFIGRLRSDWFIGRLRSDWFIGRLRSDWFIGRLRSDWFIGRLR